MLDKLFSLIGLSKTERVINLITLIIEHLEEEYAKDQNARDAILDTIIDILQKHKTQK